LSLNIEKINIVKLNDNYPYKKIIIGVYNNYPRNNFKRKRTFFCLITK
jgi:hypothetical protein